MSKLNQPVQVQLEQQDSGNAQVLPEGVKNEITKNQGLLSYFFDSKSLSLDTKKLLGGLGLAIGTVLGINNAIADELEQQPSKELLDKCDGIDRQGVIHQEQKDGKISGFAEKKCKLDFEIAKGKEELAKGKEELAKGKEELAKGKEELAKGKEELAKGKEDLKVYEQMLALLDRNKVIKAIKEEIKNREQQLLKEKDEDNRKKLIYEIGILKKKLKELEGNVA
nr:hypothetical protein [Candidatus Gracilibacteria bacterium]